MKRFAGWIKQVSIAAEDRGFSEGAEHMAQMACEAGFQRVEIGQTKGKPGVFATIECGRGQHYGRFSDSLGFCGSRRGFRDR